MLLYAQKCIIKQQVGTISCYTCAGAMITKQPLPISHQDIMKLVILKAPNRAATPETFGNLTWEQRMLMWRKATYKKKDADRRHIYHYTDWPICERWQWDDDFKGSCNRMSQQYFQCDFTWEMAIEADQSAWRLWKAEQAAQKGQGTRKGQPVHDAQPTSYDV